MTVKGEGPVALAPCEKLKPGQFHKILRIEEAPEDLTHFRLNLSGDGKDAIFKPATGGKFLGVLPRK
jgi:hypothetical protein